ncbi:MAG: glycosyltransferase family 4 protein [Kiritimatiellae bacterium]|nr:glycosyltransferase family 4 protein [Kiritimatiellia bacterium]
MKIALVHYHLRTGGVTRVMDDAAQALTRLGHDVAALTGEPPDETALRHPLRTGVLPALAYGPHPVITPAELVREARRAASELLGGPPDLWHIHNHALGKNETLPLLVDALAHDGERLILQPHDFAEDGRPANYAFLREQLAARAMPLEHLYPQAPHIAYAVLNDRDAAILRAAGFERVTVLPNPVDAGNTVPPPPAYQPRRNIYPTRAIRRKNIGEFLLLSLLDNAGEAYAVTRAPRNPVERTRYDEWVRFAAETHLEIEWEYGAGFPSMQAIFQSASTVISTSVAEGFGLVYLEPWPANRPLVGRNLPLITRSLCESGLDLSALYSRLAIPLEWVGRERLFTAIAKACTHRTKALGQKPDPREAENILQALTQDEVVDFGCLDESMQRDILRRLAASPDDRALLAAQIPPPPAQAIIEHNRRIVTEQFHPNRYGGRLTALYEKSVTTGRVTWPDSQALLHAFHQPEFFSLLRTS